MLRCWPLSSTLLLSGRQMALITAAEARILLKSLTGTGEDSSLDIYISRAGGLMARYCGYPPASAGAQPTLESATYTRYYGDPGMIADGRKLHLEPWPVTTITSIHVDTNEDFGSATEVTSSDYSQRGDHGEVIRLNIDSSTWGTWPDVDGAIKVVMVAGYTTIREDLKQLCAMTVKHLWGLRETQGAVSTNIGGVSTQLRPEDVLPLAVRQGLAQYRLPSSLGLEVL